MKIVFFGTPDYVLPILKSLHKTFRTKTGESPIIAVVTQKPRPVGRKKILTYSAVDAWAHKRKIPVFHNSMDLLKSGLIAEVGVLAAFGSILAKKAIDFFPKGILNIHPSLLPEFRGASPVQATIVTGQEAGATIIKIDEKMDHGPIVSQFKEEVQMQDTADSLRERLFKRSAEVLTTLLRAYLEDKIKPREQDHKKATFTTLVKKAHAFIPPKFLAASFKGPTLKAEWKIPFIKDYREATSSAYTLTPTPYTLERFIRAMQPWPVAWTKVKLKVQSEKLKDKRLKIINGHLEDGKLIIDDVQLEGKNPVSWKQLTQGYATVMFE